MSFLTRIQSTWRRFRKCESGVGLIEFAFAAPIIITAVAGVIELSLVMFTMTLVEGGLRQASRYGITNQLIGCMTREEYILYLVEKNTIGLIDMNTAQISTKVYPDFGSIGKPEPYTDINGNGQYDDSPTPEPFTDMNGNGHWDEDMGDPGVGGPLNVVEYSIEYDINMLTPIVGARCT